MLSRRIEDDSPGRHVDSHRKRLRCKQDLDITLLEQHFNDFFQNGQNATVMNSNSSTQQLANLDYLRKFSVRPFQTTDALVKERVNMLSVLLIFNEVYTL